MSFNYEEEMEIESKFIDESLISMIKTHRFIYDESQPVEGDRKKLIEETFEHISTTISKSLVFHEISGMYFIFFFCYT